MNRTLLTLAMASILATGCARAAFTPEAASAASPSAAKHADDSAAKTADATDATKTDDAAPSKADATADAAGARKPGDFIIYRFTGSFRKAPLTLTERVVDRQGAILTVDVTAEEGDTKRQLRVKFNEASATKNDVVAVSVIESGKEKPGTIDAYEALLAETALAADQNEAMLGSEETTLDIGGAPMPIRKTSYRVKVGKKQATLRTLESDGFAWGDLGGEITASNGKVLYRAEIVEVGHADPAKATATAQSDLAP